MSTLATHTYTNMHMHIHTRMHILTTKPYTYTNKIHLHRCTYTYTQIERGGGSDVGETWRSDLTENCFDWQFYVYHPENLSPYTLRLADNPNVRPVNAAAWALHTLGRDTHRDTEQGHREIASRT